MVQRDRVFAHDFNGYWRDIGTIEAYYQANMDLLGKRPLLNLDSRWPILTENIVPNYHTKSREGKIANSLVSLGCIIKGRVENSILSPGVIVDEKAIVSNSVVMANTFIGYHSVINRCICYIGFEAGPLKGEEDITVLGKGVVVPSYTAIGRKCKVLPYVGTDAFRGGLIPTGSTVVRSLP
jgi:glucose-1-phosphate adenylyltransferase